MCTLLNTSNTAAHHHPATHTTSALPCCKHGIVDVLDHVNGVVLGVAAQVWCGDMFRSEVVLCVLRGTITAYVSLQINRCVLLSAD